MSEQILAILRRTLEDLNPYGGMDPEAPRNALKEALQYYVLNFIYHHPQYNKWVMYGGSALRIIHGLDRMSIDLDFEVSDDINKKFLDELKEEIKNHFLNTYNAQSNFLTITTEGRGLLLRFNAGEALGLGLPSKQVHVKIDLNQFTAPKAVIERRPINRDQLSFVIKTYNMATLMASKIAAIFLRGTRGVGKAMYEEKGRDIYDLLWYMHPDRKVVPNLDYLTAKGVKEAKDLRTLFDKLTLKMNAVSNANLKQDLLPLFLNRTYIENWLTNWRESYLRLVDAYKVCTVTTLANVEVYQDSRHAPFSFTYIYNTTEKEKTCDIRYEITASWVEDLTRDLPIAIDQNIVPITRFTIHSSYRDRLRQYITLFHQKTENYLKKTNRIMLGRSIATKLIRMTADRLNQKEQIVLNKSALLSRELEDLLK